MIAKAAEPSDDLAGAPEVPNALAWRSSSAQHTVAAAVGALLDVVGAGVSEVELHVGERDLAPCGLRLLSARRRTRSKLQPLFTARAIRQSKAWLPGRRAAGVVDGAREAGALLVAAADPPEKKTVTVNTRIRSVMFVII